MTAGSRTAKGLIRICRPVLASLAAGCSLLGHIITVGGAHAIGSGLLAAAVVFLLSAGTMPLNDVMDAEADALNRPERPIPSGAVPRRQALVFFIILTAGGLALCVLLPPAAFAVAVAITIVSVAYNLGGKRVTIVGNLMVSAPVASTFVFGALVAADAAGTEIPAELWYFVAIAFVASLGFETAGDLHDAEGDAEAGSRSVAARFGLRPARRLYLALEIVFAVSTVLPIIVFRALNPLLLVVAVPAAAFSLTLSGIFLKAASSVARTRTLTVHYLGTAGFAAVLVVLLVASQ